MYQPLVPPILMMRNRKKAQEILSAVPEGNNWYFKQLLVNRPTFTYKLAVIFLT